MSSFNVRLPEDLEQRLSQEAQITHRSRSELARDAIREYLTRVERDRFLEQLNRAARVIGQDPALRHEAETMAEAFRPLEDEASDRTADDPADNKPGDAWWR